MSESENRAANWTIGLVGSIVLHALVLGLFVTLGARPTSTSIALPPATPEVSDTPETPVASETPAPSETPVRAESHAPAAPRPQPVRPPAVRPQPPVRPLAAAPAAADEVKVYVVQKGDNASQIARRFNLTLNQLAALNGVTVKKLDDIAIGQKLKVAE